MLESPPSLALSFCLKEGYWLILGSSEGSHFRLSLKSWGFLIEFLGAPAASRGDTFSVPLDCDMKAGFVWQQVFEQHRLPVRAFRRCFCLYNPLNCFWSIFQETYLPNGRHQLSECMVPALLTISSFWWCVVTPMDQWRLGAIITFVGQYIEKNRPDKWYYCCLKTII